MVTDSDIGPGSRSRKLVKKAPGLTKTWAFSALLVAGQDLAARCGCAGAHVPVCLTRGGDPETVDLVLGDLDCPGADAAKSGGFDGQTERFRSKNTGGAAPLCRSKNPQKPTAEAVEEAPSEAVAGIFIASR